MFHFGLSYVGLLYLLMLFIPNIIWTKNKPKGYEAYAKKENKVFIIFERTGEILVCIFALIFSDFNIRGTYWGVWLVLSFALMVVYEIWWIRYFCSEHEMRDFYCSILGIPVAGATLPVGAFFLLGIYGSNVFLMIAVILLGIGHINIHLQHRNEIFGKKKRKLPFCILKWFGKVLGILVIGGFVLVIGCRNINYRNHYRMLERGVDEGEYISLGGQEQYVLMRGMDKENPVMIYLHGGPSASDTFTTYCFSDKLTDKYTILAWDQRGCGRTYFHNKKIDPANTTVSFQQAKEDLDDLVNYALERFGQEQVVIMGHSYGTILGSEYALEHPDKVAAYIGVAQVVSLEKSNIYSYETALQKALSAGEDTTELTGAFEKFQETNDPVDMMALRSLTMAYHPVEVADQTIWASLISPYFGVDDMRWFLKQLGDMNAYFAQNESLFLYTFEFDAYENSLEYGMPVCFISGTCDWICPLDSIKEYKEEITAPSIWLEGIEGCGHNVQYSLPGEVAESVKRFLQLFL